MIHPKWGKGSLKENFGEMKLKKKKKKTETKKHMF